MDDDLNTADALAVIFDLVKDINLNVIGTNEKNKKVVEKVLSLFNELTQVLGILYSEKSQNIDDEIENLINLRQEARKNKDFKKADEIRDILKSKNVVLEDTPQGVKWTIKNA